ncbi:hypothetical protein [Ferrimonas marina]|uniref:MSHA biogenesis protein MshN n=1 Tax=Ferrimonas marina TaxID=299255 RepID=A0A1M5Y151_9GAMM|nr:hypothetical protein [Ferrimonas marina]SHI05528.1 hypothetical protein SAMN02745129_3870 [Ferrimonas marina]
MSVINEALKKLELSGQRGGIPARIPMSPKQAEPPRRRWRWPLALLVLALLLWLWWPWLSASLDQTSPPAAPMPAQLSLSAAESEPVREVAPEVVVAALEAAVIAPEPAEPMAPAQGRQTTEPATETALSLANQPETLADPVEATLAEPILAKPSLVEPIPEPTPEPALELAQLSVSPSLPAENTVMTEPELAHTEPQVAPAPVVRPSAMSDAERAQRLWQQAQGSARAEQLLAQALALDPALHGARHQWLALQPQQRLLAEVQQAAEHYPGHGGYQVVLAQALSQEAQPEAARAVLSAIPTHTLDIQWRSQRAQLAQQLDLHSLASADWRALLTEHPNQPHWWLGLAYSLEFERAYAEAAEAYGRALALPGLSPEAQQYARQRRQQIGERG